MTARPGRVLVTGASRGIGAAVADALADLGFELHLWARSGQDLARVAASLRSRGATVSTACVDMQDEEQVAEAAADLLRHDGRLNGAVLNAGRGRWAALEETTTVEWTSTVQTNLSGTYYVIKSVLPQLKASGPGALLVGMLSDTALYPFPNRSAYAASKAGMRALLESVRREFRADGVRVSLIVPGRVDSHFAGAHESAAPGSRPGALAPADVARVVAGLYTMPPHVEVRELHLAALTTTFGPFPEVMS